MIETRDFGGCTLYTITAGELSASVAELGASLTSLRWRGREMVLGYDSAEGYRMGTGYVGAVVGRCANRIAGAAFTLNGRRYALAANEGRNQLHGGPEAFDKRLWTAEERGGALRLTLCSPDGDNGFPGALTAAVIYSIEGDALRIDFEGESDADTVFAPASHSYFTLGGGDALSMELWINASRYLETDAALIPTAIRAAEGDFDFRSPRTVGRDYDHCFLLDGERACVLRQGGVGMELRTDFPALQIYTGAFLPPPFRPRQGLAIEPEFCPDSPNRPELSDVTLRAGQRFHRWMSCRFFEEGQEENPGK